MVPARNKATGFSSVNHTTKTIHHQYPSQNPFLAKLLFWSYCPQCSWPIRSQDSLKCNNFKGIKLFFCLQINIIVSFKLVLLLLVGVARNGWSSQNNKFTVLFKYFKKEVRYEYDFYAWRQTWKFSTSW